MWSLLNNLSLLSVLSLLHSLAFCFVTYEGALLIYEIKIKPTKKSWKIIQGVLHFWREKVSSKTLTGKKFADFIEVATWE
jgi:hypothetical protein